MLTLWSLVSPFSVLFTQDTTSSMRHSVLLSMILGERSRSGFTALYELSCLKSTQRATKIFSLNYRSVGAVVPPKHFGHGI